MKISTIIIISFLILFSCKEATDAAQYNNPAVWEDAETTTNNVYNGVDYILKGFDKYDIVAIGETHGITEVADFYIDLVRNEEFRKKVDVIVFELGNSLHQEDLDNYILGGDSDTLKIMNLWRDHSSSFLQSGDRTGVKRFFKEARNANLTSDHKVRVLAAEPPIEWMKINSAEELLKVIGLRDKFYGDLVTSEVLMKKKKALLIMGMGHFNKSKQSNRTSDNPIAAILKSSDKNLILISTLTLDDSPYDLLPGIKKGELIETINPIVGDLKIGTPFLKDYTLKVQTDALLYLGEKNSLEYEVQTPFDDGVYENELERRKELFKML